jgi:hypothetical protein
VAVSFYYHPDLGPKYLRRLFGEMDVTLVADLRQAVDWLGRRNFYVGRYGSEKLLNEFRKEFPEIKIVGSNGAGNVLADIYG